MLLLAASINHTTEVPTGLQCCYFGLWGVDLCLLQ